MTGRRHACRSGAGSVFPAFVVLVLLALCFAPDPAPAQPASLGGADAISGYHDWRRVDPPHWEDYSSIAFATDGSGWLFSPQSGRLYRLHASLGWRPHTTLTGEWRFVQDGLDSPLFLVGPGGTVRVYRADTGQWQPFYDGGPDVTVHDVASLPLPRYEDSELQWPEFAGVVVGQRRARGTVSPLIAVFQPPSTRWTEVELNVSEPVTAVAIREPRSVSARAVVVTADTAVFISEDEGYTFTRATMPPSQNDRLRDIVFFDAKRGWAVGDDGTVLSTTSGGRIWFKEPRATRHAFVRVSLLQQTLFLFSERGKGVADLWTMSVRGETTPAKLALPFNDSPRAIALDNRDRRWLVGDRGLLLMQSRLSDDRAPWEPPRMFEDR